MKRNIYDKSCYQAVCGQLGRLMNVFRLPVLANDTVSINFAGIFRLSQLRRWLTLDCNLHIAFYYVKHRWCYDGTSGVEWSDFIKKSISTERAGASTLETITNSGGSTVPWAAIGDHKPGNNTFPAHVVKGWNKLYNRFYRIPNVSDPVADTAVPSGTDIGTTRRWGPRCARLPALWNTGVPTTNLTADASITDGSAGSADTMSLLDIAQIQAEYQDDLDRDWFSHRYRDVLASKWGSTGISPEIDENEAELLMDWSGWCSGMDIHQTDSNVGNYVGKTQQVVNVRMPPRYFNEHGTIWCVALARFPSIVVEEAHYTDLNTLTADNFLAYPEVVRSSPPEEYDEADLFDQGDSTSYGTHPSHQYYRWNNNRIHYNFGNAKGFPFLDKGDLAPGADLLDAAYDGLGSGIFGAGDSDEFFKESTELGHWNMVSKAEIEVRSTLPHASESIFAGARHIN